MITLSIEQGLLAAVGTAYCSVLGIGVLVGGVILAVVLRQRIHQIKKGEQHAYRDY